jgi:hypothetical protein
VPIASGSNGVAECLVRIRAHQQEMLADLSAAERSHPITLLGKVEARER